MHGLDAPAQRIKEQDSCEFPLEIEMTPTIRKDGRMAKWPHYLCLLLTLWAIWSGSFASVTLIDIALS